MEKPLVSVKTITYNHQEYIAQCIEGVMKQKTNFSFEYIIAEDCSTDHTLKIVKEYANKYPEIIKVISSDNNVGACENDHRSELACRGKYVALCEGDDYWTDPFKLQKQIDFLQANPDYGLVHSSFSCLTDKKILEDVCGSKMVPTGNILASLIKGNCIATGTVCVRNDLLKKIRIGEIIKKQNWGMGDYPLWIEIAALSKIGYISDVTSVYRVHFGSITHGLNWEGEYKFFMDRYRIKRYYAKKYKQENILPFIDEMYHRELLKYAIFLRDKKLRNNCISYFEKAKTLKDLPFLCFSKFSFLDSIFEFIYRSKKRFIASV
nr:glycosyltransferase [uncultured Marinifilum sp.]